MTRAADFLALDQDIRRATRAAERRREVEKELREAAANADGLSRSVAHLDDVARREEADVDALDGSGGWFARLTGAWADRVDREVMEALEARRQADHARREFETVSAKLAEARRVAAVLAEADVDLLTALRRKHDRLVHLAHTDASRVVALDDERARADERAERFDAVLRAGHAALAAMGLVERELSEINLAHVLDEVDPTELAEWRTWQRSRSVNAPLTELRARFAELAALAEEVGLAWMPPTTDERVGPRGVGEFLSDAVETALAPAMAMLSGDFKRAMEEPEAGRSHRVRGQLTSARADLGAWCDGLLGKVRELRAERDAADAAWRQAVIAAGPNG